MATPNKAVSVVAPSADEVTAILRGMNAIETPTSEFHRVKLDGSTFYLGDEPFVSNPKTGVPAFTARLISAPAQYQALWFDDEVVAVTDRTNMLGKFCKSWFDDPAQARNFAEDGTSCKSCPVNPFIKDSPLANGKKCQWKGDIEFQLVDPETGMLRDDTIWTLSLSTTGMIEWQGTSRDPVTGSASELNSMRKLALLGIEKRPNEPTIGIRDAINALGQGLVIAEFRALSTENASGSRRWTIPSVTPIDILEYTGDTPPALADGTPDPLDAIETDDLPI